MAGEAIKHGNSPGLSGYRKDCRCTLCRAGKRDYMRLYRSRKKEAAAAAAGEEPMVERAAGGEPDRPELTSSPALDLTAPAGAIELAFDQDLKDPAGEVLWVNSYLAMARFNARMMDQVVLHERLDLMPSVMLRQNDILNKLTYLKLDGHLNKSKRDQTPETAADSGDEVAKEAERMLDEIANGGPSV